MPFPIWDMIVTCRHALRAPMSCPSTGCARASAARGRQRYSFDASALKSSAAATASILMDLAFRAGVTDEVERFDPRALDTATALGDRSDL